MSVQIWFLFSFFPYVLSCLKPETCNFIEKETLPQVFSYKFWEISKNIFFYRTPPVAASVIRRNTIHEKDENTRIKRKEIWKKSKGEYGE